MLGHRAHAGGIATMVEVDQLIAEFSAASNANAVAVREGRQWVAKNFYADGISLSQLRLTRGWSQAELAHQASTSQSYIARLEQGLVDPQLSTVQKIATALNVPFEYLATVLVRASEK